MDLLIRNLVTATTIPEKPSITGIIYIALTILIGVAIIVALIAVLQSIPSFREQSTAFKFVVFVLVIIATPIAIFAVPIAKIVSKVKARKVPKAPKNSPQPHSKLTADDIVFTFNSINDMKQNLYVGGEPIKVEKVDDTTVTFTLAEPSASVVELLSAETFILPKHIFEGKGSFDVNMLEDKVVGSGPYMLEEYKTGEHLKFVKNPNYANGEANIDTIVYRIIENSDTASLALQKQEVDALSVTVDQVDTIEGDDNFTVSKYSEGRVSYLRLNSVAPSMKDKDYREGIFRALNRDEIMTAAFTSEDYYKLGYTFLPYSSSYYTEDGVEKWDQDVDKAEKLTANGAKSLKLCYVEESTEQKNEALTIQAELKAIGIDVELCGVNQAAYMSAAYDPECTDYDMFLGAYVMGIDPDTFAPLFDSTKDDMMNFHNADIDAKFNEAATTLDDSKRKELYSELQVLVSEEALQYPMGTSMKTVVTTARVGGLDDAQFVPIYTFGDVSKLTLK